jgi:hypothetical protein
MKQKKISILIFAGFLCCVISFSYAQESKPQVADTLQNGKPLYDPFGPENSPDHNGQGSGGVVTPSPYEGVIQTYYTRISADYHGIQHMLDCPWQFSSGLSWSSDQTEIFGILFKVRSTGFKKIQYDLVVEDTVPRYRLPFEASMDYSLKDKDFQAFKFRIHWETHPKSLGMAGVGVLVSDWNLMVARDLQMDRKWDIELTLVQVAGGYIMPLSPKVGGVNIAICGAVDLLGVKHLTYNSDRKKFYGAKIGSIGWLVGAGWNALSSLNLSVYVGGEWGFSTGTVELPTFKIVRADIGRNTLYFGMQLTGRYFNLIGGIQKEWEYIDFQKTVSSEKGLRYYLGANYYVRR